MKNKKVRFAVILILAGGFTGALAIFFGLFTPSLTGRLLAFTTASLAILAVIIGSVVAFTTLLDRYAVPVADELHLLLSDDLEDLQQRRFTTTHAMLLLTVLCSLGFLVLIAWLDKFTACWGIVPVFIPGLLLILPMAYYLTTTGWFRNQTFRTPLWVYLIPVGGLLLSTLLGITNTESAWQANIAGLAESDSASSESYFYDQGFELPGLDLLDGFDCDGDGCELLFLLVLLVIVTLILVAGSASIPHFWVFAGLIYLALLIVITTHELSVIPPAAGKDATPGAGS